MDIKTLADQIERLRKRFGAKAFDDEFIKLVKREVLDMADYDMINLVDIMIGTRPAHKAPTIVDFREGRHLINKRKFSREVEAACISWDRLALPEALKKYWPGCVSATEAMEVEILKMKVAKANVNG